MMTSKVDTEIQLAQGVVLKKEITDKPGVSCERSWALRWISTLCRWCGTINCTTRHSNDDDADQGNVLPPNPRRRNMIMCCFSGSDERSETQVQSTDSYSTIQQILKPVPSSSPKDPENHSINVKKALDELFGIGDHDVPFALFKSVETSSFITLLIVFRDKFDLKVYKKYSTHPSMILGQEKNVSPFDIIFDASRPETRMQEGMCPGVDLSFLNVLMNDDGVRAKMLWLGASYPNWNILNLKILEDEIKDMRLVAEIEPFSPLDNFLDDIMKKTQKAITESGNSIEQKIPEKKEKKPVASIIRGHRTPEQRREEVAEALQRKWHSDQIVCRHWTEFAEYTKTLEQADKAEQEARYEKWADKADKTESQKAQKDAKRSAKAAASTDNIKIFIYTIGPDTGGPIRKVPEKIEESYQTGSTLGKEPEVKSDEQGSSSGMVPEIKSDEQREMIGFSGRYTLPVALRDQLEDLHITPPVALRAQLEDLPPVAPRAQLEDLHIVRPQSVDASVQTTDAIVRGVRTNATQTGLRATTVFGGVGRHGVGNQHPPGQRDGSEQIPSTKVINPRAVVQAKDKEEKEIFV